MKTYCTKDYYNQAIVKECAHVVFVFGDNQERVGHGGQAIVRDLPNTFGVATKRSCGEYMTGTLNDFEAVLRDLRNLEFIMKSRSVIFPILHNGQTSLGCGLADLPRRAPHLYGMIDDWFQKLGEVKLVRLVRS